MVDKTDVFHVPVLTDEQIYAVQAVWSGKGNEGQQRMALEVVIDNLSMADFMSYKEGSFDGSAFLAGRSFVGKQVRRVIKTKVGDKPQ